MARTQLQTNLLWQTANTILVNALGFATSIITARFLGTEGFGIAAYVFSLLALSNILTDAGLTDWYLRRWSQDTKRRQQESSEYLTMRLLLSSVGFILLFVFFWFTENVHFPLIVAGLVANYLDGFLSFALVSYQSQHAFHAIFRFQVAEKVATFFLFPLIFWILPSLTAFYLAVIIGKLLALSLTLQLPWGVRQISLQNLLRQLHTTAPLLFAGLCTTAYFRVDTVVLRSVLGFSALGQYSGAYRFFEAALFLPILVGAAATPHILALGKSKDAQRAFALPLARLLIFCTGGIAGGALLFGKHLLMAAYGASFFSAAPSLSFLALAIMPFSLNQLHYKFAIAQHKEKHLIRIYGGLIFVSILGNLVLDPYLGHFGAAIMTVVCEVLALIFLTRSTGLIFPPMQLIQPLIPLALLLSALFALLFVAPTFSWLALMLYALGFFAIAQWLALWQPLGHMSPGQAVAE